MKAAAGSLSPSSKINSSSQSLSGTPASSSSSHIVALASEGARQSPRGDKEPPDEIFGPLGSAERLNWLSWKKRYKKMRSHCLISASVKARRAGSGVFAGHFPRLMSCQAFHDK